MRSLLYCVPAPLNAALGFKEEVVSVNTTMGIQEFGFH